MSDSPAPASPAPTDETLTLAFLADLRGGADPHAIAKAILRPSTRAAFDEAHRRYLAGFGASDAPAPPREEPWNHSDPSRPAVWIPGGGPCICPYCKAKRMGAPIPQQLAVSPAQEATPPRCECGHRWADHGAEGCTRFDCPCAAAPTPEASAPRQTFADAPCPRCGGTEFRRVLTWYECVRCYPVEPPPEATAPRYTTTRIDLPVESVNGELRAAPAREASITTDSMHDYCAFCYHAKPCGNAECGAREASTAPGEEDATNLAGLIVMCRDLKGRLVPFGASAEGWDSAIATLQRCASLRATVAALTAERTELQRQLHQQD